MHRTMEAPEDQVYNLSLVLSRESDFAPPIVQTASMSLIYACPLLLLFHLPS